MGLRSVCTVEACSPQTAVGISVEPLQTCLVGGWYLMEGPPHQKDSHGELTDLGC